MPKPHVLFEVWSPDEVAECLPGVVDAGLYSLIWELGEDKEFSEVPDNFADHCLANKWDELGECVQTKLNELAIAHDSE